MEKGEAKVENAYKRTVPENGNIEAKRLMETFLEPVEREWRGIGRISFSGFFFRKKYTTFDAVIKFPIMTVLALFDNFLSTSYLIKIGIAILFPTIAIIIFLTDYNKKTNDKKKSE